MPVNTALSDGVARHELAGLARERLRALPGVVRLDAESFGEMLKPIALAAFSGTSTARSGSS